MNIAEELVAAAMRDIAEPPDIEFIGAENEEFAEQMRQALKFPTNDARGRRYRLAKVVFEEIP